MAKYLQSSENIPINETGDNISFNLSDNILSKIGKIDSLETKYNNLTNYSTEETYTGSKWIDGKPIYRKVIDCGALPNNSTKNINTNLQNISNFISISGVSKRPADNNYFPLNLGRPKDLTSSCALWIGNNYYIYIQTDMDRSNFTETYVILEYTKTTD